MIRQQIISKHRGENVCDGFCNLVSLSTVWQTLINHVRKNSVQQEIPSVKNHHISYKSKVGEENELKLEVNSVDEVLQR